MLTDIDFRFMAEAIALAHDAASQGEVPVGCLVVRDERVFGRGSNRRERCQDPLAHAELIAIRDAARNIGFWRLEDTTLYVTLEPCPMCAGAIINSRVGRLVYGARDPKAGSVESLYQLLADPRFNHRPIVDTGCLADECGALLSDFFAKLRHGNVRSC